MSACVSPPQPSVSHIVQPAASIAAAASTALPPFCEDHRAGGRRERLAGDGEPVLRVERRLFGLASARVGVADGARSAGGVALSEERRGRKTRDGGGECGEASGHEILWRRRTP